MASAPLPQAAQLGYKPNVFSFATCLQLRLIDYCKNEHMTYSTSHTANMQVHKDTKGWKRGLLRHRLGFAEDRVHGDGSRKRTAKIHPSKTDGQDPSVHDRTTADGNDDVGDDVITGDGSASRARRRTTARRRKRRTPTRSGRHGELTGDQNNERRRPATRSSGGAASVDDGDGAPVTGDSGEGTAELAHTSAHLTAVTATGGNGGGDGATRLKFGRRRRRRGYGAWETTGEGQTKEED
uniref:Retrotransposon protein, putative, unclassified n=1 Tax=Oryza sativa subsp. japonica TaxID=39947 RepID=Q2R3R7_ORYSJ|nr:retrotransposon protein, putative, unclassified [Oryza sativa Japonica Group]